METKKLKLNELKVNSFITVVDNQNKLNGGSDTTVTNDLPTFLSIRHCPTPPIYQITHFCMTLECHL